MDRANKKYLDISEMKKWDEYQDMYSSDKSDDDKTRRLIIYTEPVPKGRPRFTRQGHAYTPKETLRYESKIRTCWQLAHLGVITGEIKVRIDFYMPIPKSMSKADKQRAIEQELLPAKRPDIDNLAKSVLDALNEVAYWDDNQIVKLRLNKWYATEPRVEITIMEI